MSTAEHDRIVLDLSPTEFIDSSGLWGAGLGPRAAGARGTLAIVASQGAVARLSQLSRMDRICTLHPTTPVATG